MRKLRYCVAASLDGFIAGSKGELDWIVIDPSIDFESFFKDFDTVLMGRITYEITTQGGGGIMPGMKTLICSRSLKSEDHPEITLINDASTTVRELKSETGKDIWLFGGGGLFRSLLDDGLVDTVEVGVIPILLSQGIPLLPGGQRSPELQLIESKPMESGTVGLIYKVKNDKG